MSQLVCLFHICSLVYLFRTKEQKLYTSLLVVVRLMLTDLKQLNQEE